MDTLEYTMAVRLLNLPNGSCTFQYGKLPNNLKIEAGHFWLQKHTTEFEGKLHPAPEVQYVVTLSGQLKFTVTDGSSFIIRPGVIIIAADIEGLGHRWDMMDGSTWARMYIPVPGGQEQHFIANER